jgi:hypothetical protein
MHQSNTRPTVEAGIRRPSPSYSPSKGVCTLRRRRLPLLGRSHHPPGIRHGFRWSLRATVVAGVLAPSSSRPSRRSTSSSLRPQRPRLRPRLRAGFGASKPFSGAVACLISILALMGLPLSSWHNPLPSRSRQWTKRSSKPSVLPRRRHVGNNHRPGSRINSNVMVFTSTLAGPHRLSAISKPT